MDASNKIDELGLKLALSDGDNQLQDFASRYLVEIIRTGGQQTALLPKVQETLTHLNRRVRNNAAISLPVLQLLDLLSENNLISTNLAFVYLRMAKTRISDELHLECLPKYLVALATKPSSISFLYDVLSMALPGLLLIAKTEKHTWHSFGEFSADLRQGLKKFFRSLIAFTLVDRSSLDEKLAAMESGQAVALAPGISSSEYKLIAAKIANNYPTFTEVVVGLVRLLAKGFLNETDSFPLLVFASSLSLNSVDAAADSAIKTVEIQKCVDDRVVVAELMHLFLGSQAFDPKIAVDEQIYPADIVGKQKILLYLTRSTVAPVTYMNNIKIVMEGLKYHSYDKFLSATLLFLLAIVDKMPISALTKLGPLMFKKLNDVLAEMDVQGSKNSRLHDVKSVPLIYRCLGAIGKAYPKIIFENMDLIVATFENIVDVSDSIGFAAVDCLVAWIPAFCNQQDETIRTQLKATINKYVTHESPKCRIVALKFIEALFSSDEMDVKWMLLNASGDSRDEMRGEAYRLLEISLTTAPPNMLFAVNFVWSKINHDILAEDGTEVPVAKANFPAAVHEMCSRYLWALMEREVGFHASLKIVEGDDHWLLTAPKITTFMANLPADVRSNLTRIAVNATRQTNDVHMFRIASSFCSKTPIRDVSLAQTNCVQKARSSVRSEFSSSTSYLAAILLPTDEDRCALYSSTIVELEKGVLSGLCWLAAYSLPISAENLSKAHDLMKYLVKTTKNGYETPTSSLEASLGSLAALLNRFHSGSLEIPLSTEEFSQLTQLCVKIATTRKDTITSKAREFAVKVLGQLPSNLDGTVFEQLTSVLYEIGAGPPQPELQLTVGESLFDACLAQYSPSKRNVYITTENEVKAGGIMSEIVEQLELRLVTQLDCILNDKLLSGNHHLRRAAIIWLLVLVQKCPRFGSNALNSNIEDVQGAFAEALTENDEFTQDMASKGMSAVYQMASEEQKKRLIGDLMSSISEGRRSRSKLQGDSVVFSQGQFGKTPTGSSLSTYKELCTLATDLNQPDLVYKFMALAKHNATWNSKKGAAFGFSAVFEAAREELDPYIGKLVPKLFRYRYDPDMKVQQSMRSIWTVLTQTKRNVVDEFADEIFTEIVPQLTTSEWRARESSCLALSDLLRGHDTPKMHARLPELMLTLFRVSDDIKESVRIAAKTAIESVRRLVVMLSSSTNAQKSSAILAAVLPPLMDQCLHSTTPVNKAFSLLLLIELAKKAGSQLKAHLPDLIPILLDSITSVEPALLNYVAARSTATELEELDDARAQMARTSPMMTAIHDLLPQIDNTVLLGVHSAICDQIKSSVGVSTRAAASQFITQLALRAPQLMMDNQPVCDRFFAALQPGIRDKNASIRKNFANTMSYLAKFTSPNQMKMLAKLVAKDLTGDNDDLKLSSLHTLKNLVANSNDILAGYASDIVPYVFLETCLEVVKGDEESKKKQADWAELWNEIVPSTSAAVRLYRREIVSLAVTTLQNNQVWSVRSQAATMLAQTANTIGEALEVQEGVEIFTTLLPLLNGRIWKGKEKILTALAAVAKSSGPKLYQLLSTEQKNEAVTILKREACKRDKSYAAVGVDCLAEIVAAWQDVTLADWLANHIDEKIKQTLNPSENDMSSEDESITAPERQVIANTFVAAHLVALAKLLVAYSNDSEAKSSLELTGKLLCDSQIYWRSRQDFLTTLQLTVEKWEPESPIVFDDFVKCLVTASTEMREIQKTSISRQVVLLLRQVRERATLFSVSGGWDSVMEELKESSPTSESVDEYKNVMKSLESHRSTQ